MPFVRAWAVGAMSFLGATLAARAASTAPASGARLVYSRSPEAASCPDEDALRRTVAARVGYDSFFPWAKRTVLATVSRRDGAFVARVDLVDEQGIRHGGHELRTDGACGELLDPVALAVAIAIDPKLLLARPVAADAPPPRPAFAFAFETSLGVAGWLGVTPAPSFGPTLHLAWTWRRLSLGLEGFVGTPSSTTGGEHFGMARHGDGGAVPAARARVRVRARAARVSASHR